MRFLSATIVSAAAWLGVSTIAFAFPDRPITLVAPFAAGGTSDALARTVAEMMSAPLGQRVIVENKSGAGGTIGLAQVARAQPDGYTIGLGGAGSLVHSAGVYAGQLTFDVKKDFLPIALLATTPVAIAVSSSLGVTDLKGLAEKAKAEDGGLTYGSAGAGGALHLGAELFQKLAAVKMSHVPYRGVAPAMTDLLGGHLPVVFGDVSAVAPQAQNKDLKIIAVLAKDRVPQLPDVPTAAEQGYKDLIVQVWYGLVAPAKVPEDVKRKLQGTAAEVVKTPEFARRVEQTGFTTLPGDEAAFRALIDSELALWLPIIKAANVRPQ
jgi:tripartite-type tricarboxylate transporter receptor subunit TctC